jgi:HEAT repeat protein
MFDFFKRSSGPSPRQIEKAVKRLTETHGEEGPRIEAAQRLFEWGTPESLYALLKRFTISSRVITQDIEEKRMVVEMLQEKGTEAVGPILRFMKHHHRVDWPVEALAGIVDRDELVRHLIDTIEAVAHSEFAAPEHRVSLIRAIQDHVTVAMVPMLRTLLDDSDDDVRIATVEALSRLGEDARETLLETFIASEDRPRIRRAIVELFAENEWNVKGYRPTIEAALPEGYALNAKGVVQRRDAGPEPATGRRPSPARRSSS